LSSFLASALGASAFFSSFFAGAAAAGLAYSFLAGACATADNANTDATIANNAFMLFPFEMKSMTTECCHLYI
jgi:hypothetical protein